MSFFGDIGKGFGAIGGGLAGAVAGFPGMIIGGGRNSKLMGGIGNMTGRFAGIGGDDGGDPYGGMPGGYPSYVGMEPNSLELSGQFSGPNDPLNKFAQESMRNEPARGTQFALQQNRLGVTEGRDQARRMASGMGKDASANLAMHGGLGAGAAERIGKYSTNIGMEAAQAADAQGSQNRAGLLLADEAARTGGLAQAAGLVQGANQMKYNMAAGDIARKQAELDRRNAYGMNLYNTNMQTWAAGKQADATAKSGKKS